jgi:hypothetical protein
MQHLRVFRLPLPPQLRPTPDPYETRSTRKDHGALSVDQTYKLCGDHSEHVYCATRMGTHGLQCHALAWSTAEPDQLLASTSHNCIGEGAVEFCMHARMGCHDRCHLSVA